MGGANASLRERMTTQAGDRWLGDPRGRPEVLLLDPADRSKLRRSARLNKVLSWMAGALSLVAVAAIVVLFLADGSSSPAAMQGIAVGGIAVFVVGTFGGLAAGRRLRIEPNGPLTRDELDSYPGLVATQIRFRLAELMPSGIGPGQCRPTDVALDPAAESAHRECWAAVLDARAHRPE